MPTCSICGKAFGTASLATHEVKCFKKFNLEQEAMAPSLPEPLVSKPEHCAEAMESTRETREEEFSFEKNEEVTAKSTEQVVENGQESTQNINGEDTRQIKNAEAIIKGENEQKFPQKKIIEELLQMKNTEEFQMEFTPNPQEENGILEAKQKKNSRKGQKQGINAVLASRLECAFCHRKFAPERLQIHSMKCGPDSNFVKEIQRRKEKHEAEAEFKLPPIGNSVFEFRKSQENIKSKPMRKVANHRPDDLSVELDEMEVLSFSNSEGRKAVKSARFMPVNPESLSSTLALNILDETRMSGMSKYKNVETKQAPIKIPKKSALESDSMKKYCNNMREGELIRKKSTKSNPDTESDPSKRSIKSVGRSRQDVELSRNISSKSITRSIAWEKDTPLMKRSSKSIGDTSISTEKSRKCIGLLDRGKSTKSFKDSPLGREKSSKSIGFSQQEAGLLREKSAKTLEKPEKDKSRSNSTKQMKKKEPERFISLKEKEPARNTTLGAAKNDREPNESRMTKSIQCGKPAAFCVDCGVRFVLGAKFCGSCGLKRLTI